MINKTKSILLYSKISNENNLYVKLLTENDELISGIVYGGATSSKKNIYQLGYFLKIILSKKNRNKPFNIKAEVEPPYLSHLINDKYKLQCIIAFISLINLSIIDGQKVKGLFLLSENVINNLIYEKKWLVNFLQYLFILLKIIGYEIDYTKNDNKKYFDFKLLEFTNTKSYHSINFPHQLMSQNENLNFNSINSIFNIFEYVFEKNHLINMNLKLPISFLKFKKLILDYFKNND